MDTTLIIKRLVILEIILSIVYLSLSLYLESKLPQELQEYLWVQANADFTVKDTVFLFCFPVFLLLYIFAVVGLLRTRQWAKKLYLSTILFDLILAPFIGHTVAHLISTIVYSFSNMVTGCIVGLLLFSQSKFNKAFNPPLAGTAQSAAP